MDSVIKLSAFFLDPAQYSISDLCDLSAEIRGHLNLSLTKVKRAK